ncbi:fungal-specific transcription factor domain-containing protein [Lophiotrema nucula]|uniref:Fungal-specific transcription factor domain-containing protein n=1 Tax=Lophiotrema nucula TaxID=690887 RepID=A0A6A5ZCY9_9PLEO|nr:fungal-specific transcription factor domain-containing protein [Lophiotrema nucula]
MRNPVACVTCRSAKQKCLHNDAPPCDRCKASGRADLCQFPPPGTSAIHRRPKRPRQDSGSTPQSAHPATAPPQPSPFRRTELPSGISPTNAAHSPAPNSTSSVLDGLDPFDLLTDEVKNSYLRCSYKWSFHHTPTLLLRIRDRTLEIWMAWAILALAIRFVKDPPAPFKTQTEASNAFAAHARQILQSDLETPSISRVQALLMLTGHDWGAGNGRRAWIYLGMAIRLCEVMDLCQEKQIPKNRQPTREEFIEAEVRRRTAWTCFLMDSLLSGGKGRKRSLNASEMTIQLPCERESFVFGEPVCTQHLDGSLRMPPLSQPIGELGIIAYSMRAANIWGKVARWACSDVVNSELPWSTSSQFQLLIYELDEWRRSLPARLQYDLFSLHSHNAVDQGQAYCYMHCIYFMSYMFLHRAYLPVLGPHQNGTDETPRSYDEQRETWNSWQKMSRKELFRESTMVLEMLEEMRTFGVYFLRGLVPWIGFTIYTAVGVMLYSFNFPSGDDDPRITEKARERVIQGCVFLKEMKTQWPMAATWFETIKRMQAYYRNLSGQDGQPVSPEERHALRHAMIDYGALQPSPVQKPVDAKESKGPDSTIQPPTVAPGPLISPPTSTPNGYTSNYWNPQQQIPPLEADETFNLDNFDFSDADMEAMMMNATQDFWASFPGEVGVGYQ